MELRHILCRSRDFAILVGGSNFEEHRVTSEDTGNMGYTFVSTLEAIDFKHI